jgi:hypothetical protein
MSALLGPGYNAFGQHWYVDGSASQSGDGLSPDTAFLTMAEAFAVVDDDDTIHLRGPIFENLTCPQKSGVTILGSGAGLRHGSLTNTSEGQGPSWRTASGVTTDPLLVLTTQGWTIANILMAPPSADAGIEIQSDSTSTPEKTCSGTRILNCRFAAGKYAINDNGGSGYVTVAGCHFDVQTTCSIINTSTGNALPLAWRVLDNYFSPGSATHIDAAASKWEIKGNSFGTVASTALYVDLTGGANNVVTGNTLGGAYTTGDYVAGTSDLWLGNWVTVVSTQAPNGFTILAAAA